MRKAADLEAPEGAGADEKSAPECAGARLKRKRRGALEHSESEPRPSGDQAVARRKRRGTRCPMHRAEKFNAAQARRNG